MKEVLPVMGHTQKGFIRLVDSMGTDLSIVRAARVSYNADWRSGHDERSDEKLLRYLMKNRHTSPFEAVLLTFEVKCPIFIARQLHRHRTGAYNEISARYTELDEGYYLPDLDKITTQSEDNKQARTDEVHPDAEYIREGIDVQCALAFETYRRLLDKDCPRELARGVLPVNAYTRMFWTVNLHNFFHWARLRLHGHTQYEHRVYAEAAIELITPIVPVSVEAFMGGLNAK